MKYQKEISRNFIKVWEDFYINYLTMFNILRPVYKFYKDRKDSIIKKKIHFMESNSSLDENPLLSHQQKLETDEEKLEQDIVKEKFTRQFLLELQKVDFFYNENINRVIKPKLKEIKSQIVHAIKTKEFMMNSETFEMAIKESYKDINLTRRFIETNLEIKNKLMHKYRKYFGKDKETFNKYIAPLDRRASSDEVDDDEEKDEIEEVINDYINFKSSIGAYNERLREFEDEAIRMFIQYFSYKYKSKAEKILKNYIQVSTLTEAESIFLGFFIGLLLFILTVIIILASNYDIDMDHDVEFKSVFPMFRGFFIICLYWWINGINILIWTKADINYRVIFQIDNNYSKPIEIFKRAAIFTFILFCCLLIYMIKRIWSGSFFSIFNIIPINCLPLIFWGSLIIYIFCPLDIWNYDGRAFLGDLFKESIASFLIKPGFRHVFLLGQLCSFIAPMRDLEYTICYYAYYDAPFWAKKQFCNNFRGIYFFIAFIPNFLRILQTAKEIYNSRKFFPKIISIMNSFLSITVALLSFFWPTYPSLRIFWIIITFISSCSSFVWDIIIDFGFLEKGKNYPLRNRLYYKPKIIYYLIAASDFVLRFFWLLTISPEVLGSLFRPETLSIILNSLEMIRRGSWNVIKIEYKYIDISNEFKVSNDIELPFVKVNGKYVNNESNLLTVMTMDRKEKITIEIEKILEEKYKNKTRYISRNLTDLNIGRVQLNYDLKNYLEGYQKETEINKGTITPKKQ